MLKRIAGCAGLLLVLGAVAVSADAATRLKYYRAVKSGWLWFDNDDVALFHGAVGRDGALTLWSYRDHARTALDIGPTRGALPTADALAEVVLYRTQRQDWDMERMNWTAGSQSIPMYRFGVERSGAGEFHPICFSFEDVTPGSARIPLCMDPPVPGRSTQLVLEVNTDGAYHFANVEVGEPDSAGPGYRSLRIAN